MTEQDALEFAKTDLVLEKVIDPATIAPELDADVREMLGMDACECGWNHFKTCPFYTGA